MRAQKKRNRNPRKVQWQAANEHAKHCALYGGETALIAHDFMVTVNRICADWCAAVARAA